MVPLALQRGRPPSPAMLPYKSRGSGVVPCGSYSGECFCHQAVHMRAPWFLCGSVWFHVVPSAPQRRKPPFLAMLPCSSRGSCVVPCGSYGGNRFCRQAVLMEVPWFAPPKASQKIITKMGKRLASQFPNLVIISGPGTPRSNQIWERSCSCAVLADAPS